VAIGVEFDTAWSRPSGRTTVPSAVRIFVNASIDLVKAFTKQGNSGN
jgi:hypothetical protein